MSEKKNNINQKEKKMLYNNEIYLINFFCNIICKSIQSNAHKHIFKINLMLK